jgi:hypothetical protein
MDIVILYRDGNGMVTATYGDRQCTVDPSEEWAELSHIVSCELGIGGAYGPQGPSERDWWLAVHAGEERNEAVVRGIVDMERDKDSVRL